MNTNEQFSDVDKLLSAFFKAEMPASFPAVKLPAQARADFPMPVVERGADREGRTISKSRLSLAVSVALLFGGCLYLSGQMGRAPERPTISKGDGNGGANLPKPIRNAIKDSGKTSNMP